MTSPTTAAASFQSARKRSSRSLMPRRRFPWASAASRCASCLLDRVELLEKSGDRPGRERIEADLVAARADRRKKPVGILRHENDRRPRRGGSSRSLSSAFCASTVARCASKIATTERFPSNGCLESASMTSRTRSMPTLRPRFPNSPRAKKSSRLLSRTSGSAVVDLAVGDRIDEMDVGVLEGPRSSRRRAHRPPAPHGASGPRPSQFSARGELHGHELLARALGPREDRATGGASPRRRALRGAARRASARARSSPLPRECP